MPGKNLYWIRLSANLRGCFNRYRRVRYEIHIELANRFEHVATARLTKEAKELIQKHQVPSNCTRINAPQLNAEIKAALNEIN